jgi:hypothetical protein
MVHCNDTEVSYLAGSRAVKNCQNKVRGTKTTYAVKAEGDVDPAIAHITVNLNGRRKWGTKKIDSSLWRYRMFEAFLG